MQISGPPFSPLPPGSGGVPGVCASRLLQGRTPDGWPQRAPGPSLQQLRDRVDHQGAGRHAPLRTAHPGRVNGATDRGREGGGCIRVEVGRVHVALLTLLINWQPNPTPALSERLLWNPAVPTVDCWQFSIIVILFILLVFGCLLLDSFNGRELRRFQRRTDTACTLCFGHSWAIFKLLIDTLLFIRYSFVLFWPRLCSSWHIFFHPHKRLLFFFTFWHLFSRLHSGQCFTLGGAVACQPARSRTVTLKRLKRGSEKKKSDCFQKNLPKTNKHLNLNEPKSVLWLWRLWGEGRF